MGRKTSCQYGPSKVIDPKFVFSSSTRLLKDEKENDEVQTWATVASGKYKISNNK